MPFARTPLHCILLHAAACLFLGAGTALAQDLRPSAEFVAAIDRVVAKAGITQDTPGVAVFIRVPGKVVFQKGYGLADMKAHTPITRTTLFELASCSKPFTATAILILRDRGLLTLNDPIRKHIPELPAYDPAHPVLIRDLLQHTSGLPEYFDFEDVPRRAGDYSGNADYIGMFAKVLKEHPQRFRTGSKFVYTNSNFLVLASIVQRVAKKPFGDFVRDEIFIPAGMQHSFVCQNPQSVPQGAEPRYNRALGYTWNNKPRAWEVSWGCPPEYAQDVMVVGDGGVWSNLEDMAKWDTAVRTQQLLKPETWKLALTPSTTRDGTRLGYGKGWFVYANGDGSVYGYGHDGSWSGFETTYYRHLGTNRSTVILSNRDTMDTDKLWEALDAVVEKHIK